jgi:hypothetical protein
MTSPTDPTSRVSGPSHHYSPGRAEAAREKVIMKGSQLYNPRTATKASFSADTKPKLPKGNLGNVHRITGNTPSPYLVGRRAG